MRPYLFRTVIRIARVLKIYGNLKFPEILIKFLQKDSRKKLLDFYHELGIREAEKHFIIQPESEEYPFLEAFIFNIYKYYDYNNKIVIDVGAQTGDSVLYFFYHKAKMIYAFEPLKNNFRILEKNVVQNKINCILYNVGLGDSTKEIEVDISDAMAIAKPLVTSSLEHEKIKIDKLDNFNIYADVIKIDVEGFEIEVIKGGLNTFKNAKAIIIETHSKNLQVEVAKMLSGLGFHLNKIIKNYSSKNVRVEYWLSNTYFNENIRSYHT